MIYLKAYIFVTQTLTVTQNNPLIGQNKILNFFLSQ